MSPVYIDVWSDYVCPFCYLAEPVLARVQQERGAAAQIQWHAYELRPTLEPDSDYLQEIWARAVYPMAKERGMWLRLPPVQPRSRLAHEAAAFAGSQSRGSALQHAIFKSFFEHGEDIGEIDVLVGLGEELGLDPAELRDALQRGPYRDHVLADEQLAATLGLSSVPAIVVRTNDTSWDGGLLIEGAQPYSVIAEAIAEIAGPLEPHPAEKRSREP